MQKVQDGFTLIEILLVLAIISLIVYLGIGYYQQQFLNSRLDKTSVQMQEVLTAGLAFYVGNGRWPGQNAPNNASALTEMVQDGYLPPPMGPQPPWVNTPAYSVAATPCAQSQNCPSLFAVWLTLPQAVNSPALAQVISGKLPLSYTSTDTTSQPPSSSSPCTLGNSAQCSVVAQVNIPGQNLNNAMAVNFAGIYNHGGCVPVPNCPATDPQGNKLSAQVFLVPVSISGIVIGSNGAPVSNANVTSINSFTAYAKGPSEPGTSPAMCSTNTYLANGSDGNCGNTGEDPSNTRYWRACMQVVTANGDVGQETAKATGSAWGNYAKMAAFTRCAISNEPAGSSSNVYSN